MSERSIFETDGIRGEAGKYPVDYDGAFQLGQAVGVHFAEAGGVVAVGRDPRESSPDLSGAVMDGLNQVGVHAEDIGVIPTPGLFLLAANSEDVAAGVTVTASHNPFGDNGLKACDGGGNKLSDDTQKQLEARMRAAAAGDPLRSGVRSGRRFETNRIGEYEDFLLHAAGDVDLRGLRIGIDMANGATSGYAERIFRALGADVVALFDRPNGHNINQNCGATDTSQLQLAVVKQGLDLGVAFDGDGDRLTGVDEEGRPLDGDHMLYINAVDGQEPGVVATVMSNKGLETALGQVGSNGIPLYRTDVGDRNVLRGLRERGLNLGGEQSGHMIFLNTLMTGDGILAAINTVRAVRESGAPLTDWRDRVRLLPQRLVNVKVTDKHAVMGDPRIAELVAEFTGEHPDSRLLLRQSGTEQLVRVMVEADNAEEQAAALAAKVAAIAQA